MNVHRKRVCEVWGFVTHLYISKHQKGKTLENLRKFGNLANSFGIVPVN